MISVSIPTILRPHTSGDKRVRVQGGTVAEVISDLERNYPGLAGRVARDGKLHRYVNVYVDDEDVRFNGGLQAIVPVGATVTILPAVAGG
ncbi:MoaD/ThiS family protein [Nocardia sp. JMUB6875]|uniref:MoaD/ThiS family protein n=1 Tax=Nocardia sp. JMUB6875 TaxID=3158170 RepID=UPI0032E638D8